MKHAVRPQAAPESVSPPLSRKRFQYDPTTRTPTLQLDAEGNIQHMNAAARRLLEYPPGSRLPTCFFSHVHGRNLYQVMRDVADMVCHGKRSASWLVGLRTGTGRWRWYRAAVQNHLQADPGAITIRLRDLQDA